MGSRHPARQMEAVASITALSHPISVPVTFPGGSTAEVHCSSACFGGSTLEMWSITARIGHKLLPRLGFSFGPSETSRRKSSLWKISSTHHTVPQQLLLYSTTTLPFTASEAHKKIKLFHSHLDKTPYLEGITKYLQRQTQRYSQWDKKKAFTCDPRKESRKRIKSTLNHESFVKHNSGKI